MWYLLAHSFSFSPLFIIGCHFPLRDDVDAHTQQTNEQSRTHAFPECDASCKMQRGNAQRSSLFKKALDFPGCTCKSISAFFPRTPDCFSCLFFSSFNFPTSIFHALGVCIRYPFSPRNFFALVFLGWLDIRLKCLYRVSFGQSQKNSGVNTWTAEKKDLAKNN